MKTCLYFTTDLMFSSRVKPVANDLGFEVKFAGFESSVLDPPPDLAIFDLECISETELKDAMSVFSGTATSTVAYAPHVKTDKLDSARNAGVEVVWTRGQFSKSFGDLFR